MTSLAQLQGKLQSYLMQEKQDILPHILNAGPVSAETRLGIYQNAYRFRLIDALAANYPILQTYLGQDSFQELGRDYTQRHPSPYRSLRWFGDQLAPFLQEHPTYREFPFLAELAQLEWTMDAVFDAPDSAVISVEEMAAVPPELWIELRFLAHPSVRSLRPAWNVLNLWQALMNDQTPPPPQIDAPATTWIFWRQGLNSRYASLPEDEAWALDALLQGSTFGAICEGLGRWQDQATLGIHAASLLKGWITVGLIAEINL